MQSWACNSKNCVSEDQRAIANKNFLNCKVQTGERTKFQFKHNCLPILLTTGYHAYKNTAEKMAKLQVKIKQLHSYYES